jgi:hypothetical protein
MPAPGQSSFDGNPNLATPTTQGYRPGPEDFDGAAFEDLGSDPPNQRVMESSDNENTKDWQLISVSRMIPWGSFSLIAGATPSLAYWRLASNLITSGTGTSGSPFTVVRNAAGDYSITYPTGKFPAPVAQPGGTLNVVLGAHTYGIGVTNITNGVRVTTVVDGALADVNCTVDLY